MSHKSTKIIAVISVIIFLVCVSLSVTAFVIVRKQKSEYLEYGKKRAEAEAQEILQKGLSEALLKTKDERTFLTLQILEDDDVIELLSLIETLGKEQGVTLTTSSLNVEKIDRKFETLAVNLEVNGSYASVMNMLNLLEHLPYQSSIFTIQLERQGDESQDMWKALFSLKVTKFKKNET